MKRLLSLLVAMCLICLAPMGATAESSLDTLSKAITEGKELTATIVFTAAEGAGLNENLVDLLSSLGVRFQLRKDALALSLTISKEDALTAQLYKNEQDGVLATCDALGGSVFYFSAADLQKLLTGSEAAAPLTIDQSNLSVEDLKSMTIRELLAKASKDDKGVMAWFDELTKNAKATPGSYQDDGHDKAVLETIYTIDNASLHALLATDYVKKLSEDMAKGTNMDAKETLADLEARLIKNKLELTIHALTDEKERPVSVLISGSYIADADATPVSRMFEGALKRKTLDKGVRFTLSSSRCNADQPETPIGAVEATIEQTDDDNLTLEGSLVNELRRIDLKGELTKGEDTFSGTLAASMYADQTSSAPNRVYELDAMGNVTDSAINAVIAVSVNNDPIGKLNLLGTLGEPTDAFDALAKADLNTALKPVTMDQAAKAELSSTTKQNLLWFGVKFMSMLPTSAWALMTDVIDKVVGYIQ